MGRTPLHSPDDPDLGVVTGPEESDTWELLHLKPNLPLSYHPCTNSNPRRIVPSRLPLYYPGFLEVRYLELVFEFSTSYPGSFPSVVLVSSEGRHPFTGSGTGLHSPGWSLRRYGTLLWSLSLGPSQVSYRRLTSPTPVGRRRCRVELRRRTSDSDGLGWTSLNQGVPDSDSGAGIVGITDAVAVVSKGDPCQGVGWWAPRSFVSPDKT